MCEAAGWVHLFSLYMVTLVPPLVDRQISLVIIEINYIAHTNFANTFRAVVAFLLLDLCMFCSLEL